MKLGPTEILVIAIIIMVIIGFSRFLPVNRSRPTETKPTRAVTSVEARDAEILRNRHSKGKLISIILVAIGALLILTAPSLIKAFFMSYIGGSLIIIIGLASLFFMSRRS